MASVSVVIQFFEDFDFIERVVERLNPWIDASLPLAEQGPAALPALRQWRRSLPEQGRGDGVDLVINADGHAPHSSAWTQALEPRFVVGAAPIPAGDHPLHGLALDPHWASPPLVERYRGWIGSNSIRELHCRVAWVDTAFEKVELPSEPAPPRAAAGADRRERRAARQALAPGALAGPARAPAPGDGAAVRIDRPDRRPSPR